MKLIFSKRTFHKREFSHAFVSPVRWLPLLGMLLASSCLALPSQWDFTGSLTTARNSHTATVLLNGRVLVAGGSSTPGPATATAELYDPATGMWTTTGSMNVARRYHTATLLSDGRVLVVGGSNGGHGVVTCELYEPATGMWTFTGSLHQGRDTHTATLLNDGTVLVAGGFGSGRWLKSVELYDPQTGVWTSTQNLKIERSNHTATRLMDGKVLIAGGWNQTVADYYPTMAELYDPVTGTFASAGDMNFGRFRHSATLLQSGKVLVAGGSTRVGSDLVPTAELYDPATSSWTETADLGDPRDEQGAVLLPDGKVMVAGGLGRDANDVIILLSSAEIYDPATAMWNETGSMNNGRAPTLSLLSNGLVLAAGGKLSPPVDPTCELYDPGSQMTATMASGRGSIHGGSGKAMFNFRANLQDDRVTGSISFSDRGADVSITKAKVRTLTFTGNSADLGGMARLGDGSMVTFSLSVTDNGSSGDTFAISLSNGYNDEGTLTSGDILIQ